MTNPTPYLSFPLKRGFILEDSISLLLTHVTSKLNICRREERLLNSFTFILRWMCVGVVGDGVFGVVGDTDRAS